MDGHVVRNSRWTDVPTSFLQAELARRQESTDVPEPVERPACGSGKSNYGYNTPIHVVALFLILALSTFACSFPVIVRRFPKLPVPNTALFVSRHFGTGVLIATAFVHLLPTAYTNLTDPCLAPFWNKTYPAMAGFIAMVSVLVVVGVEMFFATKGAAHSHGVDFEQIRGDTGDNPRPSVHGRRSSSFRRFRQEPFGPQGEDGDGDGDGDDGISLTDARKPYRDAPPEAAGKILNKPLPRTPPPGESDSDLDLDELDPVHDDTQPLTHPTAHDDDDSEDEPYGYGQSSNGHMRPPKHSRQVSFADTAHHHGAGDPSFSAPGTVAAAANEQRMILQCLLLEAGILFHSVFIGMALSVSTGPAFVVLLIAISFHQTFEGLALGSRIAAIASFSTNSYKPWLMSVLYGVTTPAGQAIGLAVQGLYDPNSELGLLMVGIVNAISSGLLLYAGLVQLLAEDFLSDRSYVDLQGKKRLQACGAVVAGSMLMALVGAFA